MDNLPSMIKKWISSDKINFKEETPTTKQTSDKNLILDQKSTNTASSQTKLKSTSPEHTMKTISVEVSTTGKAKRKVQSELDKPIQLEPPTHQESEEVKAMVAHWVKHSSVQVLTDIPLEALHQVLEVLLLTPTSTFPAHQSEILQPSQKTEDTLPV